MGSRRRSHAAVATMSSATPDLEMASSEPSARGRSGSCLRNSRSPLTLARRLFREWSLRGAKGRCCCAHTRIAVSTSGRMASLSRSHNREPRKRRRTNEAAHESQHSRNSTFGLSVACSGKEADGPGREGETGPPVGESVRLVGDRTDMFIVCQKVNSFKVNWTIIAAPVTADQGVKQTP